MHKKWKSYINQQYAYSECWITIFIHSDTTPVKQYLDPLYQKLIWFQYGSENIKGQRRVLSSVGFVDVTFIGRHQQLCGHMHDIGLWHIDCDPVLHTGDYETMMNLTLD